MKGPCGMAMVGLLIGASVCHGQNLLINGDFELFVPSNQYGNGWLSEHIDELGGWHESGGNPAGYFILNDAGAQDSDPTLVQVVPDTYRGLRYRISGDFTIAWADGGDPDAPAFGVLIDGDSVFTASRNQTADGWNDFAVEFAASMESIEVQIAAERAGTDLAYSVDNLCLELLDDPPTCEADLTGDGVVDTLDFLLFLGAWAQGDGLADWNDDGRIDTLDFLAYLNDWVVGC